VAEREAEGLAPRRDGNTVQLDRELLAMTEAAGDFAKAQTALSAKFRLVRYAINEGK
jgi:flagellar basal body rod protein FlgB